MRSHSLFIFFAVLIHLPVADGQFASDWELLSSSSLENARLLAEKVTTGNDASKFVKIALDANRLDLVEVCWTTGVLGPHLMEYAKAERNHGKKLNILLAMLRTRLPGGWPDWTEMPGAGGQRDGMIWTFLPMVREFLPETPLDYSVISNVERRTLLARSLETAARAVDISTVNGSGAPRNSETNSPQAKQTKTNEPTKLQPSTAIFKDSEWLVWLLVVIAATVGAVWVFLRKSK